MSAFDRQHGQEKGGTSTKVEETQQNSQSAFSSSKGRTSLASISLLIKTEEDGKNKAMNESNVNNIVSSKRSGLAPGIKSKSSKQTGHRGVSQNSSSLNNWNFSSSFGNGPLSAQACIHLAQRLLRSRLPSKETEQFVKRAIDSLVRKLRDRRDEVEALYQTVQSRGTVPTKCITIARSLDGRLQVAGRKCFPHVVYARIWRWPDVHKNEMVHIPSQCQYGFGLKRELVCVNPYHYERASTPIATSEEDAASIAPSSAGKINAHSLTQRPSVYTPVQQNRRNSFVIISNSNEFPTSGPISIPVIQSSNFSAGQSSILSPSGARLLATSTVQQSTPTIFYSAILLPQETQLITPLSSRPSGGDQTKSFITLPTNTYNVLNASSLLQLIKPPSITTSHLSSSTSSRFLNSDLTCIPKEVSSIGSNLSQVASVENKSTSVSSRKYRLVLPKIEDLLQNRQSEEFWCTISYFEYANNVGEPYRVSYSVPQVIVDGFTDPKAQGRFCLGQLPNIDRSQECENVRMCICQGISLTNSGLTMENPQHINIAKKTTSSSFPFSSQSLPHSGEDNVLEPPGGIWLRNRSDRPVFIRSHYLDAAYGCSFHSENFTRKEGNSVSSKGESHNSSGRVHKIYPNSTIQVYDLQWWRDELFEWARHLDGTQETSDYMEQLTSKCAIRCSFIKGWGADYPRHSIEDTPCWIEVQFHDALILLDHMLLQINVDSSLDGPAVKLRKPVTQPELIFRPLPTTSCLHSSSSSSSPPTSVPHSSHRLSATHSQVVVTQSLPTYQSSPSMNNTLLTIIKREPTLKYEPTMPQSRDSSPVSVSSSSLSPLKKRLLHNLSIPSPSAPPSANESL